MLTNEQRAALQRVVDGTAYFYNGGTNTVIGTPAHEVGVPIQTKDLARLALNAKDYFAAMRRKPMPEYTCICGHPATVVISARDPKTAVVLDETAICTDCLEESPTQEALGALDLTFCVED